MFDERTSTFEGRAIVLKPILELTRDLPRAMVEEITINAIFEHRRLLETAEELHDALAQDVIEQTAVRRRYTEAMIALHVQTSALSSLLNILGYMPKMPDSSVMS